MVRLMYVSAYKRPVRRSSLLANRSRDRRVSSKQFMLLGARHVRRALSGRALRADNTANGFAPEGAGVQRGRT